MRTFLTSLLLLAIGACSTAQPPAPIRPPSVSFPTEERERSLNSSTIPRTIEIGLTLSSPDDLKIEEGDDILAGQALADRVQERKQLEEKLAMLMLNMERISSVSKPPPPVEIFSIPELPAKDFSSEEMGIAKSQVILKIQQKAVENQKNLIAELLRIIPETSDAIAHEQAKLEIEKLREQQARTAIEASKASLESARSKRAYEEYQHALEQQKRLIDLQQQQIAWQRSQAQYEEAVREQQARQLAATIQIEGINEKLTTLTAVTSPFDGKIRRIRYEAQSDRVMRVVVILDTTDDGGSDRAAVSGSSARPSLALLESVRAVR